MEGGNSYSPARGGSVKQKKAKYNNTTNKIKDETKMALYHVTRKQGTLIASRFWAEEGAGRAKLNNDGKATAMRLR